MGVLCGITSFRASANGVHVYIVVEEVRGCDHAFANTHALIALWCGTHGGGKRVITDRERAREDYHNKIE